MSDKEYEIGTLKDVYEKVPYDKVDLCLQELAQVLKSAMNTRDLIKERADLEGIQLEDINSMMVFPDTITWKDDGLGELGFDLVEKSTDKNILSVRIKQETDNE